jgi:hypothetical protein
VSEGVRLIWPIWFCVLCGRPVVNPVQAKREHCPGCGRLGMWASLRMTYEDGCLVVGDERLENNHGN